MAQWLLYCITNFQDVSSNPDMTGAEDKPFKWTDNNISSYNTITFTTNIDINTNITNIATVAIISTTASSSISIDATGVAAPIIWYHYSGTCTYWTRRVGYEWSV